MGTKALISELATSMGTIMDIIVSQGKGGSGLVEGFNGKLLTEHSSIEKDNRQIAVDSGLMLFNHMGTIPKV